MTCGSIAAIEKKEDRMLIQVVDEIGNDCIIEIGGTNYRLDVGDYMSWTSTKAFWRSHNIPEKEIMLWLVPEHPIKKI